MIYEVNHFIEKFEAISDDKWTTGDYDYGGVKFCALGHCGVKFDKKTWKSVTTKEAIVLAKLVFSNLSEDIADINDGCIDRFNESTPKARVLAALEEIKNLQKRK